jgi:molybdate transport system substrate-binding protein
VIALSLAKKSRGTYVEIPAELHRPIDQAMAVCKRGRNEAGGREFAAFMRTPEVRALMESYGFVVPE